MIQSIPLSQKAQMSLRLILNDHFTLLFTFFVMHICDNVLIFAQKRKRYPKIMYWSKLDKKNNDQI